MDDGRRKEYKGRKGGENVKGRGVCGVRKQKIGRADDGSG